MNQRKRNNLYIYSVYMNRYIIFRVFTNWYIIYNINTINFFFFFFKVTLHHTTAVIEQYRIQLINHQYTVDFFASCASSPLSFTLIRSSSFFSLTFQKSLFSASSPFTILFSSVFFIYLMFIIKMSHFRVCDLQNK